MLFVLLPEVRLRDQGRRGQELEPVCLLTIVLPLEVIPQLPILGLDLVAAKATELERPPLRRIDQS